MFGVFFVVVDNRKICFVMKMILETKLKLIMSNKAKVYKILKLIKCEYFTRIFEISGAKA